MRAYSTREVAELLGISADRVRSFARAGFVSPARSARGHYRFSFQDLVLLRTAKDLEDANLSPRRVWRALRVLTKQLPAGRPLSSVRVVVDADRVLVKERDTSWEPETRQAILDFSVQELVEKVAPLVRESVGKARQAAQSGEEWFAVALELDQLGVRKEAKAAYREVLAIEPLHVDARINLGRLLHNERSFSEAEHLYREALELQPNNSTAAFNLGVVLEDLGSIAQAMDAYRQALRADPSIADAHYNLARLYERQGEQRAALRHLTRFKALSQQEQ